MRWWNRFRLSAICDQTMKLLITSDSDACAQMYAPVAEEMLRRGHEVTVACVSMIDSFSIEFTLRNIPVRDLREFYKTTPEFDIALCHREPLSWLRHHGIPSAHILTMISDEHIHPAAMYASVDLMLVAGTTHEQNLRRAGFQGEILRTGLPKYDRLHILPNTREKLILVPDSPSVPMGRKRFRYFEMLMDVARHLPDHQLVIKPRFLWKDRWADEKFLHGIDLDIHLVAKHYDDIPSNLTILDYYIPNEELFCRAGLVLGIQTGAVLAQMMLGKPALVIQDMLHPSECQIESEFRSLRAYLSRSGCVIWRRELVDHLPEGLIADPDYVTAEVGLLDGMASQRVADALEATVQAHAGGFNWIPFPRKETSGTYTERMESYTHEIQGLSMKALHAEQRRQILNMMLQGLQTSAAMMEEYAEDLGAHELLTECTELFETLFAEEHPMEELARFSRRFFGAMNDMVDMLMTYRQGRRYMQNACTQHLRNFLNGSGLIMARNGHTAMAKALGNQLLQQLGDNYLVEMLTECKENFLCPPS